LNSLTASRSSLICLLTSSGVSHTSVEEAAHIVRSLLDDLGRLRELSARAREVAKGFSYEKFKERLN